MFFVNLNAINTQSDAHLIALGNINYLTNSTILNAFPYNALQENKTLFDALLAKEKPFLNTDYVFYHALGNVSYVIQDIIKHLYKLANPSTSVKNFEFFRIPGNEAFNKYKNVDEFINDQINSKTEINDHDRNEVGIYILSANIALFGNTGISSESTISIFLRNKPASTQLPIRNIIRDILNYFKLYPSEENIDRLYNLINLIPDKGAIFQIFIPKNLVNKYSYLARSWGKPDGSRRLWVFCFLERYLNIKDCPAFGIFWKQTQMQLWAILMKQFKLS